MVTQVTRVTLEEAGWVHMSAEGPLSAESGHRDASD